MPTTPTPNPSAEQRYSNLADETRDLPFEDARWKAFQAGIDNADDTVREGSIERGTEDWYELVVTSYYCMLDDLQ